MIAGHLTSGEPVPIGVELWCINLARRVYQACAPKRDLLWLIQLPSRTTPALLFLVHEAIRRLDACRAPGQPSRGEPKLRTPILRRRSS